MANYADIYAGWQADPEAFWARAAKAVDWDRAPQNVLDDSAAPLYRWFGDAEANTCLQRRRQTCAGRSR